MKKLSVLLVLAIQLLISSHGVGAQQLGQKVYWMATMSFPMAKLAQYHEFAEKEMIPLQEKHGYHFIAAWQTIVGDIEEVIVVAEFKSMADYHKARVSLTTSEEWKALAPKFSELSRGVRSRFLSAVPYSKIK